MEQKVKSCLVKPAFLLAYYLCGHCDPGERYHPFGHGQHDRMQHFALASVSWVLSDILSTVYKDLSCQQAFEQPE
jgi:hypothetical protein